jgi:hypothetical protein
MRLGALALVVAAAGFTGCGTATMGQPYETDPDRPLKPGEGMFGDSTTFRLGEKKAPTPAEFSAFQKWKETASAQEREEFEAWRNWQDMRKKTQ